VLKLQGVDYVEKSVLGALLIDNSALHRARLEPEDFYDNRHRLVFAAIQGLVADGVPADEITVITKLGDGPNQREFVHDLWRSNITAENIEFYADQVRTYARMRRFILGLSDVLARAKTDEDAEVMRARVQHFMDNSAEPDVYSAEPLSKVIREVFDADFAAVMAGKHSEDVVPTGLLELDNWFGGLPRGVVTIVGGRPSMGKSSLVRTFALNAARFGGVHVFSLEDNREAFARRCLSDMSGVTLQQVTTLIRDPRLAKAAKDAAAFGGVLLDDASGLSAAQIALRARGQLAQNRTKLVVVDYVQIMHEPEVGRIDPRMQCKVSIESLAKLARSEHLAVVVVSQLSRAVEARVDKKPTLSDLRETGDLEQIANIVLLCYRDEYYNPESKKRGLAEIIVAKNKHGRVGPVTLAWDAPTATFRSRFTSTREPGSDDA
jgi:replicative DNA helicase